MAQQPIFGVTNIPQDIKLELNNGTLTLKSGSVITAPDGSQLQTTSDKSTTSTTSGKVVIIPTSSGGSLTANIPVSNCVSGSTDSLAGQQYHLWYDTTNNVINYYGSDGSTVSGTRALPIAIATVSNGAISSIDQVFNGFGYIGSSLFVLPGVEGFYPNGKDGFKNLFGTIKHNSLTILNLNSNSQNKILCFTSYNNNTWSGFEIVDELPDIQDMVVWKRYYNKKDNFVYTNNGSNVVKNQNVPYGYFTTSSSSPYSITSFEIANPFATITPYTVSEYAKYLANLLIIQYNSKPKAKATIESIGAMFPVDLLLSVRDGFNIDTATGTSLDILAKYIGASRGYTNSDNNSALLTDEEFRILLKLKIIVNNGSATLYGLETNLYNLFGTGIRVVEDKDAGGNQIMSLTYYIRSDWENVGLAAVQQDILPHPTGVGYSYNLAAQVKYFGFVDYLDQNHPYSTGFRDYNDPTKQGEMYAYDKVIS